MAPLPKPASISLPTSAPLKLLVSKEPARWSSQQGQLTGGNLWADQPALVLTRKADFDKCGVRMVAVVKEDIGTEVKDFHEKVWPEGDIFLDSDMAFYKPLFGGEVSKEGLFSFAWKLFMGSGEVSQRMRANKDLAEPQKAGSNLKGEGLIRGGLYVVRQGGPAEYAFAETEIMDHAPVEDVLAAAARAAAPAASAASGASRM